MIEELERDPNKRFSFAEVGFLTRWLEGRPVDGYQVKLMKKLVQDGQIEFIGGGWVQPDEATSYYNDIIDQYSLGFSKLKENFGDDCGKTKVAWQVYHKVIYKISCRSTLLGIVENMQISPKTLVTLHCFTEECILPNRLKESRTKASNMFVERIALIN